MNVTIHLHDEFKRQFRQLRKKHHSLTDDLEDFQKELIKNPFQGDDLVAAYARFVWLLAQRARARVVAHAY